MANESGRVNSTNVGGDGMQYGPVAPLINSYSWPDNSAVPNGVPTAANMTNVGLGFGVLDTTPTSILQDPLKNNVFGQFGPLGWMNNVNLASTNEMTGALPSVPTTPLPRWENYSASNTLPYAGGITQEQNG